MKLLERNEIRKRLGIGLLAIAMPLIFIAVTSLRPGHDWSKGASVENNSEGAALLFKLGESRLKETINH